MEVILLLIFLIFLIGTGLAIYGAVRLIADVTRSRATIEARRAQSACLLLNELLGEGRISQSTYDQLRSAIEQRHAIVLPTWLRLVPQEQTTPASDAAYSPTTQTAETESSEPARQQSPVAEGPTGDVGFAFTAQAFQADEAELVQAEVIEPFSELPGESIAGQANAEQENRVNAGQDSTRDISPWDVPDVIVKPRRPWKELLAGFMQEKNIRWGELASGVLIVGCAFGLVVSLRKELQETIPYFPALMFLLITAAIHAAGNYTLKKWKLRNTSRGVLVIGLLLVPLNFLAACILTGSEGDRRELTDPIFWISIAIGLSCFSALTWYSAKSLLIERFWPLVVAILGSSAWMLVVNRVPVDANDLQAFDNAHPSGLLTLLLTIPPGLAFLAGTIGLANHWSSRKRLVKRSLNKLLIMSGMASFALLLALSIFLIRWPHRGWAFVSLTTVLVLASLVVAWHGAIAFRTATQLQVARRMVGTILFLSGLIFCFVLMCVSAVNPIILLLNGLLVAGGAWWIARNRNLPLLYSIIPVALSTVMLTFVAFVRGIFSLDRLPTFEQYQEALLSSINGFVMVGTAGVVALLGNRWLPRAEIANSSLRAVPARSLNQWIAMGLGAMGCALAVIAGFRFPDNTFDVMSGTLLLTIAAWVVTSHAIRRNRPDWGILSIMLVLGSTAQALAWNRMIMDAIERVSYGPETRFLIAGTMIGFWFAIASVVYVRFTSRKLAATASLESETDSPVISPNQSELLDLFRAVSTIAFIVTLSAAAFLVPYQTGIASIGTGVTLLGILLNAWTWRNWQGEPRFASNLFRVSTIIGLAIVVAELGLRSGRFSVLGSIPHLIDQLTASAMLCTIWQFLDLLFKKWPIANWLVRADIRLDRHWFVAISFILFGMLLLIALPGVAAELSATATEHALLRPIDFVALEPMLLMSLSVFAGCLLLTSFLRPNVALSIAAVNVGFAVASMISLQFADAIAVGSALRWLASICAIVFALWALCRPLTIGPWNRARRLARLTESSAISRLHRQAVVNWTLGCAIILLLTISTTAITVVMMNGAESLGGPIADSWFGRLRKDISFGGPVAIIVLAFFCYAISEQRVWLANCGSLVFQYVVGLSVVLLFLSPHPKLATAWFVGILQSVCLSMSLFGIAWYYFRNRIDGRIDQRSAANPFLARFAETKSSVVVHLVMNQVLFFSLIGLIIQRFFFFPNQNAGWIEQAGGLLGLVALVALVCQTLYIWRNHCREHAPTFVSAIAIALLAIFATQLDRSFPKLGWLPFNTILAGSLLIVIGQAFWWGWRYVRSQATADRHDLSQLSTLQLLLSGWQILPGVGIMLAFAIRGSLARPTLFWWYILPLLALIVTTFCFGVFTRRTKPVWVAAVLITLFFVLLGIMDPNRWVQHNPARWISLLLTGLSLLGLSWNLSGLVYRNRIELPRGFNWFPQTISIVGPIWLLLAALLQWCCDVIDWNPVSVLANQPGYAAIGAVGLLIIVGFPRGLNKAFLSTMLLWLLAIATLIVTIWAQGETFLVAGLPLSWGLAAAAVSLAWQQRNLIPRSSQLYRVCDAEQLGKESWFLPIWYTMILLLAAPLIFGVMAFVDERLARYLGVLSVAAITFAMSVMTTGRGRVLQIGTLLLLSATIVSLMWASLQPIEIRELSGSFFVRTLIGLAIAASVQALVLPRYISSAADWRRSLHVGMVVCVVLATFNFLALLVTEAVHFQPEVGCGTWIAEALITCVVLGLVIASLIWVAVSPQHDPLLLSATMRRGYVYAAEILLGLLILHAYLSMPYLFRIGLKEYWPYIVMAVAFGGIAVSEWTRRLKLDVLSEPLYHTALVMPLIVGIAIWLIDSQAQPSLVMLLAGLVYLAIGANRQQTLFYLGAVAFANVALWLFYQDYPALHFQRHPQLWLIPVAVSTLVATQLNRKSLGETQAATIRYVSIAILYISSTSEILLQGLGEHLWPPMVLALLSVLGIFAGMMFRVRAYLFLGMLFLLVSVASMVAHAHQRLGHTWPWWAFGIGLGIAILTMFGIFEKRRRETPEITKVLDKWDW